MPCDGAKADLSFWLVVNTDYEISFSLGQSHERIINSLPSVSAEAEAFKSVKLLVDAIHFYADDDNIQLYAGKPTVFCG